jgi:hypothetical protein
VIAGGRDSRIRSSLKAARAASGSLVSNDCGSSPGPGTLCARVPAGMTSSWPASSVKAKYVPAASTERFCPAVRRKPSFAIRSW